MSNPFIAEIRIFAGNFAPKGWALCNGQLLPISQNTALFSLIGTFYGGDGKSTMALPNLQGCAPMHPGQGPGLSDRFLGESAGDTSVTLTQGEMPFHNHMWQVSTEDGEEQSPANNYLAVLPTPPNIYAAPNNLQPMAAGIIQPAGGGQPHNNLQPYLTLNFIIALVGIFPSRS